MRTLAYICAIVSITSLLILFFQLLEVEEKYKTPIGILFDRTPKVIILGVALVSSLLTSFYVIEQIRVPKGNNVVNSGLMLLFLILIPVIDVYIYLKMNKKR